jgi:ATP-dependent DNA helicase RecG
MKRTDGKANSAREPVEAPPSALERLIAGGESLAVELKADVNDNELVETVVCLANGEGGTLLIGVDDDGQVCGARPRHGAGTDTRRVEALVSNSTRPSLGVQAELEQAQGKPVLVIRVPKAVIPAATSAGRYLRRALGGDGRPACVPMFVYEQGAQGLAQDPSSAVVPGATFRDLDPLEIERFRRFVRESGGLGDRGLVELGDEDLCRALGGLDANGVVRGVRRLGLLLFGRPESLQRYLPTHEIAWQVLEDERVLENEIHRLPLLRSFEDLMQRFRARNRSVELVDLFRTEVPDFSEQAFREALANALTHRDYSRLGAVHVQWTREGIRIDNPGGLPEGVRLDNLLVTPPRPRNLLLADAFKRAGLVERTGRGVDAIFYGQLRYGRAAPRYTATAVSVSVVLPGGAADLDLVRWVVSEGRAGRRWALPELLLLRACTEQRTLSTDEAARVLQSDAEHARAVLARMVDAGVLEPRGERRAREYHLSAEMYRALGDKSGYVRTRGFEPLQQEQMVLQYARQHGQITRREAADLCRVAPAQASRLLARVATRHPELQIEGERRGARYVWKGAPARRGKI